VTAPTGDDALREALAEDDVADDAVDAVDEGCACGVAGCVWGHY
jgi:hypothetical protein